jgi:hypothetical protein
LSLNYNTTIADFKVHFFFLTKATEWKKKSTIITIIGKKNTNTNKKNKLTIASKRPTKVVGQRERERKKREEEQERRKKGQGRNEESGEWWRSGRESKERERDLGVSRN